MRRTPQPTFTQSKLTSLMATSKKAPAPSTDGSQGSTAAGVVPETERMDTSQNVACIDLVGVPSGGAVAASLPAPASGPAAPVTKDILMSALKENTDFIIKSFASSLGALTQRVESNTNLIAKNATEVDKHECQLKEHRSDIDILTVKVRDLERNAGARRPCPPAHVRAQLSQEFLRARRSLRLWPVDGQSEEDMWGGVGEFIHDILRVNTEDVGQNDIEDVKRVANISGMPETERREVLVTFYDKKKRDTVISSSTTLPPSSTPLGSPLLVSDLRSLGNSTTPLDSSRGLVRALGLGTVQVPSAILSLTTSPDPSMPTSSCLVTRPGQGLRPKWPVTTSMPPSTKKTPLPREDSPPSSSLGLVKDLGCRPLALLALREAPVAPQEMSLPANAPAGPNLTAVDSRRDARRALELRRVLATTVYRRLMGRMTILKQKTNLTHLVVKVIRIITEE